MKLRRLKKTGPKLPEPARYRGFAGICAAVLVFSLVASVGLSTRASEGDPVSMPLYAGQNIPVGEVTVWNDYDWLHVTYQMDPFNCWYLKETHLEVATDLVDIPQAKGNPIPGQFANSELHDELTKSYTYDVPLPDDWEAGDELYIAAHAVVSQYEKVCDGSTWWASSVVDYDPALRKDLTPVPSERSDPTKALGMPQNTGALGTFVSLGFGGSIVLAFDYPVCNCLGNDMAAIEVTNGVYKPESADVYVISGGVEVFAGAIGNVYNDPSAHTSQQWVAVPDGICCFEAVKLVDTSDPADFTDGVADGYDLDALRVSGVCKYKGDETAWAGTGVGTLAFKGKNWATYFTYGIETEQWDISGDWVILVNMFYDHEYTLTIVQQCCDEYSAIGGWSYGPSTGVPYNVGYEETGTFIVTGNTVWFHSDYANGYWYEGMGTIAADGKMSGNWWNDGQSGEWHSISGAAVLKWC